jgi:hypothetical protein
MRRGLLPGLPGLLALAGCATLVMPSEQMQERAIVRADPRINMGLPIIVALREVDSTVLGVFYARVSLAPGPHRLLVDCTVSESHDTARFALDAELAPGGRYVLVAELEKGLRSCSGVRLEHRGS